MMLDTAVDWVSGVRQHRWVHRCVAMARIGIGFAFIPSGLKKLLQQPFTDPDNTGPFHEFLQAFYGTGLFYPFVGGLQLLGGILLMTQHQATIGAVILSPIVLVILVFCWSTWVVPTASVVSVIMLGLLGLLLWDIQRWRSLFGADGQQLQLTLPAPHPAVDMVLWSRCGGLIALLYLGHVLVTGTVYRPQGADWSNPSFVFLQILVVLPLVALGIEQWRSRKRG